LRTTLVLLAALRLKLQHRSASTCVRACGGPRAPASGGRSAGGALAPHRAYSNQCISS